ERSVPVAFFMAERLGSPFGGRNAKAGRLPCSLASPACLAPGPRLTPGHASARSAAPAPARPVRVDDRRHASVHGPDLGPPDARAGALFRRDPLSAGGPRPARPRAAA